MLDNIKLILGLEDNSKDNIINYYIDKITEKVLNYCHLKELPIKLKGFVEDKVISIIKYKIEINNSKNKGVKSIQRGDTRIEFSSINDKDEKTLLNLNNLDMKELNSFRKVAW